MEVVTLDFVEMEGHVFDRFGEGERDNYQIDYRRIVGDMEPARPRISTRDGEPPHPYPAYALPTQHGHGHETAAQRYSATRIQAGYEPERSVTTLHIHSKVVPFFLFNDCVKPFTSRSNRDVFTFQQHWFCAPTSLFISYLGSEPNPLTYCTAVTGV